MAESRGAARPKARTLSRRRPKAAEIIAHEIQTDIAQRDLRPGARLPQESEMVAHYGVARATVREALRILEVSGLVEVRSGPNGGPVVRSATPGDFGRILSLFLQAERVTLAELLHARSLVEPMLVREATARHDPAFLAKVQELLDRGARLDVYDDASYIAVSREFHELMAAAAGNRVVGLFALALLAMFVAELDRTRYPPAKRRQVLHEHELVLKAILKGKPEQAYARMAEHMGAFRTRISGRQAGEYAQLVGWM